MYYKNYTVEEKSIRVAEAKSAAIQNAPSTLGLFPLSLMPHLKSWLPSPDLKIGLFSHLRMYGCHRKQL